MAGPDIYYATGTSCDSRVAPLPVDCGGPGSPAPPSDQALSFNGTTAKLHLPVAPEIGAYGAAFELWFKTTESTGSLLAASNEAWALYLSGGKVCFWVAAGREWLRRDGSGGRPR